jgi:ZIP family zinc transporter
MIFEILNPIHPVMQALIAGLSTWGVTAPEAATVFFVREVNKKLLDTMLGFAAGVR